MQVATYKYQLQDVKEPNLYRELYDYESIPKVAFNNRVVPMQMPAEVWITDTTFRDGQQATKSLHGAADHGSLQDAPQAGRRKRADPPVGIFRLFGEGPRRAGVLHEPRLPISGDHHVDPRVVEGFRAGANRWGLRETGVLVSCSDYHIYNKMGLTRAGALDKYLGVIKEILDLGISPRCHFEDITRADYYGFVLPFAEELHRLSEESGIPIKIRACDTMGYGIPYPGAALPRSRRRASSTV